MRGAKLKNKVTMKPKENNIDKKQAILFLANITISIAIGIIVGCVIGIAIALIAKDIIL